MKFIKLIWSIIKEALSGFLLLFSPTSGISSMRVLRYAIIVNFTMEWQYSIWATTNHIWQPSWETITFMCGVFGITFIQTVKELQQKIKESKIEE